MGMETMVYFSIDGTEVCGRVEPTSAGNAGTVMPVQANMEHMHLIDAETGVVL
jgi:multiple sugar transport system ATP-binding protein